jgi:hypothetical protein
VITVDGTPEAFHAGASASAAIVYAEKANVLAVPITAVTQSGGQSYVTVSNNGKQSKQAVTTGTTSGAQIEITGGLNEGDQVVVTIPNFGRNRTGTNGNSNNSSGNGPQFNFGGNGGGGFAPPDGGGRG